MDRSQARIPPQGLRTGSHWCVLVMSVLLGGCCGCDDQLDAVYALPDTVHVAVPTGTKAAPGFEGVVQLLHKDDGILPEHLRNLEGDQLSDTNEFPATWKWVGANASVLNASLPPVAAGRRVTVPGGTLSTVPLTGYLEVTVDDCEPELDTIVVIYEAPSSISDEVRPSHVSGDMPAVVVIEGERGGSSIGFEGSAVAGGVSVGKVSGTAANPSRVSVLRARHAASVLLDGLTTGIDAVPVPMTATARDVDVAVWIAASDDPSETLLKQALHEIRLADTILARNRVGLRLNPVLANGALPLQPIKVADPGITTIVDKPCNRAGPSAVVGERWASDLFVDAGKGAPDFTDASRLNIVYVEELFGGGGNIVYGVKCPHNAGEGGLVLVNVAHRAPTTLAHEIGHAFGLVHHSAEFTELKPWRHTNFMSDLKVEDEWLRSLDQATVGQAWIMNESKDSWPNFSATALPTYAAACSAECPPTFFGIRKFQ